MTVIERLRASGLAEAQAQSAAVAIAQALPVDRSVCVDDAILSAARQGDTALLVSLLADEVEPEDDEIAALAFEVDGHGETLPLT